MTTALAGARLLRIALALTAVAATFALACLAFGLNGWLSLGPVSLSVNDPLKPFGWGIAAGGLLLALEWPRPVRRRWIVALMVSAGMLALIGFGRSAAAIITDSDFALGELYTELATRGQLLVGPYSRFAWHHPGPLFFYVSAPFYALAGHRAPALYAVALAVNVASIVTLTWVVARERERWLLAVLLAAGCLGFAWRLPMFLASPWTAHVPVLPSLTFLVLAAAVASGRVTLLPLLAVFASFVTQTHVGFVPVIAAISAGAVTAAYLGASDRLRFWSALNRSAWISAALWLLPISEAVGASGGNVSTLWHFFVTDHAPGHSLREAFLNWSFGLTGVLRADFELPWGGHFQLNHLAWSVLYASVQLALLAVIAWRDLRANRRFEACLSLVALAASLVTLWAMTRIRGDILNHDLFRIAALGVFNLAIIVAAGARALLDAKWPDRRSPAYLPAAAFVLIFVVLAIVSDRDLDSMTSYERRRTDREVTIKAYDAIRRYLAAEGIRKPLFRIDDDQWGNAAGIILRFEQNGTPVAVDSASLPMFSGAFAPRGDEDALVTLANAGLHDNLRNRAGTVVVFESGRVYVDASRLVPSEGPQARGSSVSPAK
jgi:hypothetical protein